MAEQSILLTTFSEAQRRQALERFAVLRPALEEGISQTQIARDHQRGLSTVPRWITLSREKGGTGLAPAARSECVLPNALRELGLHRRSSPYPTMKRAFFSINAIAIACLPVLIISSTRKLWQRCCA